MAQLLLSTVFFSIFILCASGSLFSNLFSRIEEYKESITDSVDSQYVRDSSTDPVPSKAGEDPELEDWITNPFGHSSSVHGDDHKKALDPKQDFIVLALDEARHVVTNDLLTIKDNQGSNDKEVKDTDTHDKIGSRSGRCLRDCSGHGFCSETLCICEPQYTSIDCSVFIPVDHRQLSLNGTTNATSNFTTIVNSTSTNFTTSGPAPSPTNSTTPSASTTSFQTTGGDSSGVSSTSLPITTGDTSVLPTTTSDAPPSSDATTTTSSDATTTTSSDATTTTSSAATTTTSSDATTTTGPSSSTTGNQTPTTAIYTPTSTTGGGKVGGDGSSSSGDDSEPAAFPVGGIIGVVAGVLLSISLYYLYVKRQKKSVDKKMFLFSGSGGASDKSHGNAVQLTEANAEFSSGKLVGYQSRQKATDGNKLLQGPARDGNISLNQRQPSKTRAARANI